MYGVWWYYGCNVSYVNRGNQVNSFYIAKCNNTETRTTIGTLS